MGVALVIFFALDAFLHRVLGRHEPPTPPAALAEARP
jgi:hypothetical protein